jgi:hypothetical protein
MNLYIELAQPDFPCEENERQLLLSIYGKDYILSREDLLELYNNMHEVLTDAKERGLELV